MTRASRRGRCLGLALAGLLALTAGCVNPLVASTPTPASRGPTLVCPEVVLTVTPGLAHPGSRVWLTGWMRACASGVTIATDPCAWRVEILRGGASLANVSLASGADCGNATATMRTLHAGDVANATVAWNATLPEGGYDLRLHAPIPSGDATDDAPLTLAGPPSGVGLV